MTEVTLIVILGTFRGADPGLIPLATLDIFRSVSGGNGKLKAGGLARWQFRLETLVWSTKKGVGTAEKEVFRL